jgi:flotillin
MAKNIAEPLSNVDTITMYGADNTTKLMQEVTNSSSQIVNAVKNATGLDIADLISSYVGKKEKEDTSELSEN